MKTKELGVIAVKITGIACLVVAAFKFHHVFSLLLHYFLRREEMAGAELMVIAPMVSFGLIILAGLGFLFAGDRIGPFITLAALSKSDSTYGQWPVLMLATSASSLLVLAYFAVYGLLRRDIYILGAILFLALDAGIKLALLPSSTKGRVGTKK